MFDGNNNRPWVWLVSKHPDQAINHPYLGYVACANYEMGNSASLSNHNFEVISTITLSETIDDANPADVIEDFITHPRHGAAPNLNVELNTANRIFSGTLEEAQADQTLCKVGDEYFNYQVATLNGSGLYTLSDVLRGHFEDAQTHNAGEPFVRLDKAIFEYEFNENLVGKQIFLKFTSFNGLERKEQTLDEVTEYNYTLSGGRPAGVKGLSLQSPFVGTTFKVQQVRMAIEFKSGRMVQ